MKFLVDAQLPPALCHWLLAHGHEAHHVVDLGMLSASDIEISDYAERGGMIVISKDEDFVYRRLPDRFALVWLRCGNATNRALAAWLGERWPQIETLLAAGERLVEVR